MELRKLSKLRPLKAIRFVNSVCTIIYFYENKVFPTKTFQASQSWHQLSVYENKVIVQTLFTKRMDFSFINNDDA